MQTSVEAGNFVRQIARLEEPNTQAIHRRSPDPLATDVRAPKLPPIAPPSGLIGSKESDLEFRIVPWHASLAHALRNLLHCIGR